ncbi:hypothetical protein NXS19_009328 [Fusarium pseudograminearum]|nr:hypothetical protein NXS19_009328 [Fusarium pseudograminearum]
MASSSRPPLSLRRHSSIRHLRQPEHDDLAQSLNQLNISTSPGRAPSRLASEPASPFRPSGRRTSQSPAPNARAPSRSPSQDPSLGTPTLLRKASMNSLRSSNGIGPGSTSRRSSVAHVMSPTRRASYQEKIRPTPRSIAHDNLKAELHAHHGSITTRPTQTIVVLNDAVYGHRFSRPRTSRAALGTIVERPERIRAAVLGVSAAYVRLGGRHCEGEYPLHPGREAEHLQGIPFRIHKTDRTLSLLSPAVVNVHGAKWMEELKTMCEAAESKLALGGKELQRPEMNRGTDKSPEKFHEGDLYLCSESLNAMEGALGAVCEAVDTVFGPAVEHGLTHAAIIDFDLHHGDGSQAITWQHNTRANNAAKNAAAWKKSSIGYFSLHDINSYPCEMGDEEKVRSASICIDNAHGQTVWNVHLEPWKSEEDFWKLYETRYTVLLEKVRNYFKNQAERLRESKEPPKAAIFLSAGFDASEWEGEGMQRHKVNVPTEFYARIAQDVVKLAAEEGLHVDGRVISVLEGGYSDRALCSGIMSHLSGLAGDQTSEQSSDSAGSFGVDTAQTSPSTVPHGVEQKSALDSIHAYDPSWWSTSNMEELEILMGDPNAAASKYPQYVTLPSYFAPTQASTAKSSDPTKMQRSLSKLGSATPRFPSPPPPEVPWAVATHELSKLLIPSTRETGFYFTSNIANVSARETSQASTTPEPTIDKPPKGRRSTMGPTTVASEKAVARGVPSRTNSDEPGVRRSSRRLSEIPVSLTSRLSSPEAVLPEADEHAQTVPNSPAATTATTAAPNGDLQVKKTRNPAAPRKEPAPKVPRPTKKATTATGPSRPASAAQKAKSPERAPKNGTAGDDVDNITSGMRKIRINLITQSQKAAKARARLEAEKVNGSVSAIDQAKPVETPSTAAHPSKAQSDDPNTVVVSTEACNHSPAQSLPINPTPPATTSSSGNITPLQEQDPFNPSGYVSRLASPPPSSPPIPSVSVHPSAEAGDVFIPYQPEGPAPKPITQNEPLKWLPPNVPTSSAQTPATTPSPIKKNKLFQYASSSGIPFAPRTGHQAKGAATTKPAGPEMK